MPRPRGSERVAMRRESTRSGTRIQAQTFVCVEHTRTYQTEGAGTSPLTAGESFCSGPLDGGVIPHNLPSGAQVQKCTRLGFQNVPNKRCSVRSKTPNLRNIDDCMPSKKQKLSNKLHFAFFEKSGASIPRR